MSDFRRVEFTKDEVEQAPESDDSRRMLLLMFLPSLLICVYLVLFIFFEDAMTSRVAQGVTMCFATLGPCLLVVLPAIQTHHFSKRTGRGGWNAFGYFLLFLFAHVFLIALVAFGGCALLISISGGYI